MSVKGKLSVDQRETHAKYCRDRCHVMLEIANEAEIGILFQFMSHYIGAERLEGKETYEKQKRAANF